MTSRRILVALALGSGLMFGTAALADPDDDFAPHQKVQAAETDVDDDSDPSREVDVDDADDSSREVDVDDADDSSREVDVDDATRDSQDSEDGDD